MVRCLGEPYTRNVGRSDHTRLDALDNLRRSPLAQSAFDLLVDLPTSLTICSRLIGGEPEPPVWPHTKAQHQTIYRPSIDVESLHASIQLATTFQRPVVADSFAAPLDRFKDAAKKR